MSNIQIKIFNKLKALKLLNLFEKIEQIVKIALKMRFLTLAGTWRWKASTCWDLNGQETLFKRPHHFFINLSQTIKINYLYVSKNTLDDSTKRTIYIEKCLYS